jgi:hypothetical protein
VSNYRGPHNLSLSQLQSCVCALLPNRFIIGIVRVAGLFFPALQRTFGHGYEPGCSNECRHEFELVSTPFQIVRGLQ